MGISSFFLLGAVIMHRDVERTLNIMIFQAQVENKKSILCPQTKKECSYRLVDVVLCADKTDSRCFFLGRAFGCFSNDSIFVPLASSSCHSLVH
jgi:hypothetical protein